MIEPQTFLRPATPVGRLFLAGPIEVVVTRVAGQQVRLGILADGAFLIYRREARAVHRGKGRE